MLFKQQNYGIENQMVPVCISFDVMKYKQAGLLYNPACIYPPNPDKSKLLY